MSDQKLSKNKIEELSEDIELDAIDKTELNELFYKEKKLNKYLPDKLYSIDPRDGTRIIYSSVRSKRPKEVDTSKKTAKTTADSQDKNCPICSGDTTKIVHSTKLSKGITFINKNLFPVLYPFSDKENSSPRGYHFLQWTSSYHDEDWSTITPEDAQLVLKSFAELESKLLNFDLDGQKGHVVYIKNHGKMVASSLPHDHQQILYTNIAPSRYIQHKKFLADNKINFTSNLLNNNPKTLRVKAYKTGTLLVPAFMKRPYQMIYALSDTSKSYIHELDDMEIEELGLVIQNSVRLYNDLLPKLGMSISYNILFNIDPSTGLYLEFLPFTQHSGGMEKLGIYVCQSLPEDNADYLRNHFDK